jgi:hypothetical protein
MILDIIRLLLSPRRLWLELAETPRSLLHCHVGLVIIPILPALAWYYGTTKVGWTVIDRTIQLSPENAGLLAFTFYLSMLVLTYLVACWMYWMAPTYGAKADFRRDLMIAFYCAIPIYLAGILGIYPLFWLDILLGILAASYSIFLLYQALPIVVNIAKERSFLYASSLLASAMVMVIGLMGLTTGIWQYILKPVFVEIY